jgi:hypothetical protein
MMYDCVVGLLWVRFHLAFVHRWLVGWLVG